MPTFDLIYTSVYTEQTQCDVWDLPHVWTGTETVCKKPSAEGDVTNQSEASVLDQ